MCLTSGAPIPLYMLLQSSRETREIIILALLEWWKCLITIPSKSKAVWIMKRTLICGCVVRTTERVWLRWVIWDVILMIALSRQKCFHFPKWGSIKLWMANPLKTRSSSGLLCLFYPTSVAPSESKLQLDTNIFSLVSGQQPHTDWAPCLQAHVKSKLSGTSSDPRRFSGPSFWTVAHFHPDRWNVKPRHFPLCSRVSKILAQRNLTSSLASALSKWLSFYQSISPGNFPFL